MIDLSGEKSFFRFWLPFILLGGLVVLLFPKFGPREERTAREAWDGMVILFTLEQAPESPFYLLATMPLRTNDGAEEFWVIGETPIEAGAKSAALLLGTPPGSDLSRRLSRRVIRDRSQLYSAEPLVKLYRAADFGTRPSAMIGTILRTVPGSSTGEQIDAKARVSIPLPVFEQTMTVTLEPARDRRWVGSPASFHSDWSRFKELSPGGMTPFIHERAVLPATAFPSPSASER